MNRMKPTMTSVVLLFLSGCAILAPEPTATPAPTPTPAPVLVTNADQIIGIWEEVNPVSLGQDVTFLQFKEDGTYIIAGNVVSNLEDGPQEQGQFKFDEGLITFLASAGSPLCAGEPGTYEVRLIGEGVLDFSQREDPCGFRRDWYVGGKVYQPISP